MEYLIKSSAITIIFYVCYKLFLQKETFFQSNRWFLLSGIVTAFSLPFLVIPIYVEYTPESFQFVTTNQLTSNNTQESTSQLNIENILLTAYLLVSFILLARLILQHLSLNKILKSGISKKKNKYKLIETTRNIAPFSFFNNIVVNPNIFNEKELEQVIAHEKTHAKQLHSIDVLICNLLTVILWFNPFSWLYKKEILQNLEFIADQQANAKSKSVKSYQKLLLKTSLSQNQLSISNNFYQSLIKKRIIMLQKSKSKKSNLLKLTLVIPLIALFLMSFNTKEIYIAKNETNLNNIEQTDLSVITSKSTDKDLKSIKKDLEKQGNGIEIKFSEIKRDHNKEIKSITINAKFKKSDDFKRVISINSKNKPIDDIALKVENNELVFASKQDKFYQKYTNSGWIFEKTNTAKTKEIDEDLLIIIDKKESNKEQLEKISPEDINSVNVLKKEKAITKYGEKGKNGVIEVYTKKETALQTKNIEVVEIKYEGDINEDEMFLKNPNSKILIIKDGKIITKEELDNTPKENIKSINVLKGEKATSKYGKEAKNGAVEIFMRDEKQPKIIHHKIENNPSNKEPIKNNVPVEKIKSVNVLKGEHATKKYGEQAKDGAIEIYTEKESPWKINTEIEAVTIVKTDNDLSQDDVIFLNKQLNDPDSKPLIIKDNKELTNKEIQDIMPSSIKSISVLKDKKAISKYGEKGKNGVIIITTK
ncbi:M56 family metallopeptidase [Mesoflavibacter sp. CH_XMU1404-2]|uniref:M56 family metallopeptidase n=1 Tax=Mesoflavibacter sp. CH_XMU1404-2 TaxID=3107766 RepID=UPI00300BA233